MLHEKEKGRGDLWMKTGGMPRGIRKGSMQDFPLRRRGAEFFRIEMSDFEEESGFNSSK